MEMNFGEKLGDVTLFHTSCYRVIYSDNKNYLNRLIVTL